MKNYWIILLLLSNSISSSAQFDTSFAVRYPGMLGISVFQSTPSYKIEVTQSRYADVAGISSLSFNTLANNVSGFGIHYGKLSLFAGFKTPLEKFDTDRKGATKFFQFNLALTGVKLRVEASMRSYRGFYEAHSPNYLPGFTDTSRFFVNDDMKNHSFKLKALYFINKKQRFSYGAAYINNVRQLKSAGSFILSANFYNYKLNSVEPIFPPGPDVYYKPFDGWNDLNVLGVSAGAGYTHTFVIFKRFFLNLLFTIGLEEEHIKVKDISGANSINIWKGAISAFDGRSSFGYNSKRFYFSIQSIVDANNYHLSFGHINNQFISAFFNIGYRFYFKAPPVFSGLE
jgi:hypothetical protein